MSDTVFEDTGTTASGPLVAAGAVVLPAQAETRYQIEPGSPYDFSAGAYAIIQEYVIDVHEGSVDKAKTFVWSHGNSGRPLTPKQQPTWVFSLQRLANTYYATKHSGDPVTDRQVETAAYYAAVFMGRTSHSGRDIDPMIVADFRAFASTERGKRKVDQVLDDLEEVYVGGRFGTQGTWTALRNRMFLYVPALDKAERQRRAGATVAPPSTPVSFGDADLNAIPYEDSDLSG